MSQVFPLIRHTRAVSRARAAPHQQRLLRPKTLYWVPLSRAGEMMRKQMTMAASRASPKRAGSVSWLPIDQLMEAFRNDEVKKEWNMESSGYGLPVSVTEVKCPLFPGRESESPWRTVRCPRGMAPSAWLCNWVSK